VIFVALGGMLGAYFSALTRLYNVDQLSVALITPTMSRLGGGYLLMYSLVPPTIGAIAAIVLYVIFLAGLMGNGGVFPVMACKDGKCDSLLAVLRHFEPSEAQDYCKVLVRAFAAGFSERLVPNTLTSLAAQTGKKRPMNLRPVGAARFAHSFRSPHCCRLPRRLRPMSASCRPTARR
jgi:hypothetical protein